MRSNGTSITLKVGRQEVTIASRIFGTSALASLWLKPSKSITRATLPLTHPQSVTSLSTRFGAHSARPPAEPEDTLVALGRSALIAHTESSCCTLSEDPSEGTGSPSPPVI